MKTTSWRAIAELAGVAAIVASLIFVGLQLKQSQDIAVAAQYQERANAAVDMFMGHIQSETSLKIRGEQIQAGQSPQGHSNGAGAWMTSKTPQELAWRWYSFMVLFTLYDNNHFQYESGFLDEDSWMAFRTRMKTVSSDPINRDFYRRIRTSYRASFRAIVDEVISEIESQTH